MDENWLAKKVYLTTVDGHDVTIEEYNTPMIDDVRIGVCIDQKWISGDVVRAIVRKLDEIEGKAQPEQHTEDDRDNPDGEYWERRCHEAGAKLKGLDCDAYLEEYNKWDYSWNWRAIAELYERRIEELELNKR